MFGLLEEENEENSLVCLRIIIELHKQFRPAVSGEVGWPVIICCCCTCVLACTDKHTHMFTTYKHMNTNTHTHTHTNTQTHTHTHTHTHTLLPCTQVLTKLIPICTFNIPSLHCSGDTVSSTG